MTQPGRARCTPKKGQSQLSEKVLSYPDFCSPVSAFEGALNPSFSYLAAEFSNDRLFSTIRSDTASWNGLSGLAEQ